VICSRRCRPTGDVGLGFGQTSVRPPHQEAEEFAIAGDALDFRVEPAKAALEGVDAVRVEGIAYALGLLQIRQYDPLSNLLRRANRS
jgi:hypothetical protein